MLGNIRRVCKEQGMTLQQLERDAGITANTIGRWDDHRPSIDKVKRVADALGVTIDYLLREENDADD